MTQSEQQKAAKKFSEDWKDKGYEKGESQKFWLDLLCNVFDIKDFSSFITFEDQVKLDHTSFIDGYIPQTKVLIEQKSIDKDLRAPIKQSDGTFLNPFQQAKRYITELPVSKHPRWVVTCNFKSFLVYDMENPNGEPEEILLENLEKEFYRLSFITDLGSQHLKKEMELSIKAGDIVGVIYDQLYAQYQLAKNIDMTTCLKSLNMLCVRLVFCFYAEDAGIFGHKSMFGDYLKQYEAKDLREAILQLFKILDQKPEERDPFLKEELAAFPYVNGGLFTEEDLLIPHFTEQLKDLLVNKASADFNWSQISPTIFGAVFESTLNPETRRSGGMHYTSIENIHKVIDPLFMDELYEEYESIKSIPQTSTRNEKLLRFQTKLGNLKFLDPACGSGNFLTETYLSLRRLENKCLQLMIGGREGQGTLTELFGYDFVKVHIQQFYGIEINDFACVVAKTALWIAECQMLQETNSITNSATSFLPLDNYTNIIEGNALRVDWNKVVSKTELSYIMGNPPFVGARLMSADQKEDVISVWGNVKNIGNVDYVSCWYKKAADLMKDTKIKAALVSTNSITQGEQVAIMWKPLIEDGISINFAYKTFRWDSEANLKAHVHCVIVGFSYINKKNKTIYLNDSQRAESKHINPYLIDAADIFIESRKKPLCGVKEMVFGSMPNDNGNFILSEEEAEKIMKEEPLSKKYIKLFLGAEEFINNKKRYCLWLKNSEPSEIRQIKIIAERVENVRKIRSESKREATKKLADIPYLFGEIRQPEKGTYLLVPSTSSERRRYIPMGFFNHDVISSNANLLVPEAGLYEFGIMTSNVHNAWMRVVCGRLEMRYRYSASIVYNNFPWPAPTEEQKKKIECTAQAILDARALYPKSSLADLYDENYMPKELLMAHKYNDIAVCDAYGFSKDVRKLESKCVAELFKMYEELTKKSL